MATTTYTKTGTKATTAAKLDSAVFGVVPENHELIKQVYLSYLANGRENLAKTLRRGEVRGGGKKPWKQKGTGRARFGSSRNPIWRKGGVVFGPLGNENYSKKVNIKAKRQALRQALSLKNEASSIVIIDSIDIKDAKTSSLVTLLDKINATRGVLIVTDNKDSAIVRASANLPEVQVVSASYLNTYDVMNSSIIVMTTDALAIVQGILVPKKEAK